MIYIALKSTNELRCFTAQLVAVAAAATAVPDGYYVATWWHIRGGLAEGCGACRGMAGAGLVGGGAIPGLFDIRPL